MDNGDINAAGLVAGLVYSGTEESFGGSVNGVVYRRLFRTGAARRRAMSMYWNLGRPNTTTQVHGTIPRRMRRIC
jgi:hypothetical protein